MICISDRKLSSSSFSSCSTAPSTPRCNSAGSQQSGQAAPGRKTSTAVKSRRQSNLADIQSDQESLSSGSETLHKKKTSKDIGSKTPAELRRTKSVQEKGGKVITNGSRRSVRALSVTQRGVNDLASKGQVKSDGKQ